MNELSQIIKLIMPYLGGVSFPVVVLIGVVVTPAFVYFMTMMSEVNKVAQSLAKTHFKRMCEYLTKKGKVSRKSRQKRPVIEDKDGDAP
jgi:hypothetical protein